MEIHINSFSNISEYEIMCAMLAEAGFSIAKRPEEADIVLINIGNSDCIDAIKASISNFPGKKHVIAGCMTSKKIREIRKITEEASIIDTDNLAEIVQVVEETMHGNTLECLTFNSRKRILLPKVRKEGIGRLPVMSGCSEPCRECTFRLEKGLLSSYSKEDIIREAKSCLKDRCNQIYLTGQDISAFGREEIWRSPLPELVNDILGLGEGFRLLLGRVTAQNIRSIEDEIIALYSNPRVYKCVNMPMYSGSSNVLSMMRRPDYSETMVKFLRKLRQTIPQVYFISEAIVGFPGETEDDFHATMDLVKNVMPDSLVIHEFSNECGNRAKILDSLQRNISVINLEKYVFSTMDVFIESGSGESFVARDNSYRKVLVSGKCKLGEKASVNITSAFPGFLKAELA